ncbi:MAG: outer membrane protein assembly factor BamA [Coxiellaceae bacterium]|nr:outer membrane protein assembly factor BamA [Coxiellaceae bacterium]
MRFFLRLLRLVSISTILLFPLVSTAAVGSGSGVVVRHIRIIGLSRITQATAHNYVPLKVGQHLTSKKSIEVIQTLYHTGFFSDVRVNRQGNTVLIYVKERPTIGVITFSGNKSITNKILLKALKSSGIDEGEVYQPVDIHMIVTGLKQQYATMGYHDVIVDAKVKQEPRNRVAIDIQINEGGIAKVRGIKIIGNHVFRERTLEGQMALTTPGLFTWYTHSDQYSEMKLNRDLKSLTDFYMNRGYIRFAILSHSVKMSPDKKSVYITINIVEGHKYTISGFKLDNNSKGNTAKIEKLITLKKGQVFSRKRVLAVNDKISEYFSDKGFAFPVIQATPTIDDNNHTVFLTYSIHPGGRIYVRSIDFAGNQRTKDNVLRRETIQLEGALYSSHRVKESKRRLSNLPYLKDIKATPERVPGKPDLVDLHYHVTEVNAGRASIMAGYSDSEGFLYGASVSEPNFMGSGKSVGLNLTRSQYSNNYSFNYYNPFFTVNNVGFGYNLYYTKQKPGADINISSYIMDGFGGSFNFVLPISEYMSMNFGAGYDNNSIRSGSATAEEIVDFLNKYGTHFNQFTALAGWYYSDYDRAVFPTEGLGTRLRFELGVPVVNNSLKYFKTNYKASYYKPLSQSHQWIFNIHTDIGYGNGYGNVDQLPFYKNFYAGGIDTVPGFSANTLGPKDRFNNGLGGNLELVGGVDLIFPNHISDKLRTALTFSAGNIYNSREAIPESASAFSSGPLRYSAGVEVSWYSPLGPLRFSLAKVLNQRDGDQISLFNFSFGANI